MSKGIGRHLVLWTCVFGCTLAPLAHATEVNAVLRQQGVTRAGRVHDGAQLGVLYLTYHGSHAGFKVWSETPSLSLTDVNGLHAPIRVRLENKDWQSEPGNKYAVTTTSAQDRVELNLVADGEQALPAASWKIDLQAAIF